MGLQSTTVVENSDKGRNLELSEESESDGDEKPTLDEIIDAYSLAP